MRLARIGARGFRNLKKVDLRLHEGLTVVAGENGQGKTSLLEAVYLLGTGRSFRTRHLDDLIAWDGEAARVEGETDSRRGASRLAVELEKGSRRLQVNDVDKGQETFLGHLDLVDLTGQRMNVLRGGPVERRRFLDRGIVGLNPGHLHVMADYRRLLQQRNALIRRPQPSDRKSAELDAWDERLRVAAGRLHLERLHYAGKLDGRLGEVARVLFGADTRLKLQYKPSPVELGDVAKDRIDATLAERLKRGRGRDLEMGHTAEGPHRDEVLVELDGADLRRFGSAGQVRAAMIALKLGKLSLLRDERGEPPLFVMDDFDSDLDDGRMGALAGFLHNGGFQTLVATSKESQVARIGVAFMKLRMDRGVARAA